MATEKTVIELTQQDIVELVAEKYNLKTQGITYNISYFQGDQREGESLMFVVKGEKYEKQD